jgi:FeS assembly SUF system protein
MKAMIQFTETAKTKVLEFMKGAGKEGIALRMAVKSKGPKGFIYDFQLEEYQGERPSDVIVREGGFATRIDPESAKFLKGATVDWVEKDGAYGFAVQNPNNPNPPDSEDALKQTIIDALRTVFDPEIPVNIYDLGLIYEINIDEAKMATVRMTLTAPNCPAAEQLPQEVESKTKGVPGIKDAKVVLVWEPPWDKEMMSESAKLELGI